MDHSIIGDLWTAVLDLIYPPRCFGCQREGAWFCDGCLSDVPRVEPPICMRCGGGLEESSSRLCPRCRSTPLALDRIRSAAYSEGPLRDAIHAFKYDGVTALASPLASLMVAFWAKEPMVVDVVVPVPLHRQRQRRRGFNQAALLARQFSRQVGLPVDAASLVRHRQTAAQVELSAEERKANVRDAFRCVGYRVADKDVLLIDDVCTTGSTLEACATALREGGVKSVQALTLARAR